MKQVIAGDIGGTNCRLVLARVEAEQVDILYEQHYLARDAAEFETILGRFLDEFDADTGIDAACFAVAGPVRGHRATLTNLPWTLDSNQLQQRFSIGRVHLINDFVANGYSLDVLDRQDCLVLQDGLAASGTRAVVGAGTGLGMALVADTTAGIQVLASEGGHMDFAPLDDEQADLLRFLRRDTERVSYEHVVSGPGLVRLYRYYAWRNGVDPASLLQSEDAPAEVSRLALMDNDPPAVSALGLFFRIYGSCAANLALVGLATGGVYLAGGIAARLAEALGHSGFLETFNNKPPMSELLEKIPVKVITNPRAGLLGAAWYAGNQ